MNRMKRWVPALGAATMLGALVAAALIVLATALMGSGSSQSALAVFATPTSTGTPYPTATPKPGFTGNLSGVYDILVYIFAKDNEQFRCISRIDHDETILNTNPLHAPPGDPDPSNNQMVKMTNVCYSEGNISGSDPETEGIDYLNDGTIDEGSKGVGMDGITLDCDPLRDFLTGTDTCDGPPSPPAYIIYPPQKGVGSYDPDTGDMRTVNCFMDIGGSLANIIAVADITDPKLTSPTDTGMVLIAGNQTSANCRSFGPWVNPPGDDKTPYGQLPLNLTLVNAPPYAKTTAFRDYDGDGCKDWQELDKSARPKGCGDDPWNPGDSGAAMDDVSGSYDMLAIVVSSSYTHGAANAPVAGIYFECLADIQHDTGTNDITARPFCYIDNAFQEVNPEAAPGVVNDGLAGGNPRNNPPTMGAAPETGAQCRDFKDNDPDDDPSPPTWAGNPLPPAGYVNDGCPDLFADVNTKHTVLTGTLDKDTNTIEVEGCFVDNDNQSPMGNVYVIARVDQYTGVGQVRIWNEQTQANCTGGTPKDINELGQPTGGKATLYIVRQNNKLGVQGKAGDDLLNPNDNASDNDRDSDGDGCSDKHELSDEESVGGLRDPANSWDYFEPTNDGLNRVDDILLVVTKYYVDEGQAGYSRLTDRSGLLGGNAWNLGPPDGLQRVDDILASVKQYYHDCGKGGKRLLP